MGDFLFTAGVKRTTKSLNWLFDDDLANTKAKIDKLRSIYPNFLNPTGGTSYERRRETLRFAAFQLADEVPYNRDYPAKRFKGFLRWLTWLAQQNAAQGNLTVDNKDWAPPAPWTYDPASIIIYYLLQAVPVAGAPKRVNFVHQALSPLTISVTTTKTPWIIEVHSVKESDPSVTDKSDDEDDVP